MTTRATLSVVLACDNECVFCGQVGLDRSPPRSRQELESALALAREGSDEITFVGGEPTLHEDLPALVARARELGFRAVGVQTNGRRLGRAETLALLIDAGLTDVHLSIHGPSAAAHDYHTGIPGSFVASLAALSAARAAGLPVAITTVLTRSNARGLSELPRLLSARGASAWTIAIPRVRGRAAEHFDRVVPRLGIAMPYALHAVQAANALRLPVALVGAPLCLLGPFARHSLPDAARAFGPSCDGCAARASCPGVEPEYLARFAGDELSPRDAVTFDPFRLASMFVGSGALAPQRADPQVRARVALPMVGKVRPARAEVPRTAEKKTGAALRELFKDLYKEEPGD